MIFFVFLVTVLIGGSGAPLAKFSLLEFSPLTYVFLRALLAAAVIYPFVLKNIKIKKQTVKYLFAANALFAANWILFALGVSKTTVIMSQVMYVPTALIVAIIGYIFLKEKINKEQVIGLVLTLFGMFFLIINSLNKQNGVSLGSPMGNALIAAGMLTWSVYLVVTRKISNDYTPGVLTFFNFLLTIPISLVLVIFQGEAFPQSITPAAIIALVYIVLFSSIVFFMLIQWLVKHTSAFIPSLAIYPMTIIATVAGVIFYGEKISINFLIGTAFVMSGVFMATSYRFVRKYLRI